jgi:polysaccharide chain length determinant protein (PEP-CTERM system associated)
MQFWKVKALTYLSGIFLYRWYALAAAWLFCLVGWAGVSAIPDQYRAEARVYIDAENFMDPLLKGLTISIDTAQEISVMLRTLITRPTLEQVIRLTDPKADSLNAGQLEQQVAALQSKISIRQLETKNYFAIGYIDNSSAYATSVTQTLLSILQNNRIGATRLDMDSARGFINKKIAEYEDRLRDADKRRADFRTTNVEILSKGNAANRIDAADVALQVVNKDLATAIARRDSTKDQLAATPETVAIDQRMFLGSGPAGVSMEAVAASARANGAPSPAPAAGNAPQRLQQAQATLVELRTRYTEQHPDVVALKKLIADIQSQIASVEKTPDAPPAAPVMVPNPVFVQLQARSFDEETNVSVQRQRVEGAATELARAKADAAQAIDVTAKYNGLDRDYGNIESTYKELLQSREAASLSQARDDQNQGLNFRILEPPQRPQFPTAPNRPLLNSLVLLVGLAGGAAFAILLTLNAGRFITSDDISTQFGIPLIGVITTLPQAKASRGSRLATAALSTSIGLLLLSYVGVVAVLKTSIYSVLGI